MEKQIEEMAKDIEICDRECVRLCHNKKCKECEYFYNTEDCYILRLSQMLVAKGYRKASDVAREIFAEMEKTIRYVLSIIPLSYKDNLKTVECKKECYQDFLGYIAELKNKYESEGGE